MNEKIIIPFISNMPDSSDWPSIKDIILSSPYKDMPIPEFKYVETTPEEKATDDKLFDDMQLVREKIREKHPIGTEFIHDTIPCPICKDGVVSFIISDHYNGHIHAKCSNNCVDWME